MSRNSASDAKDIKKAYESLSEVKRKPTNATNDGGLLVQVGSKKDIPTVEFYLDPLCPACAQIDRTLNDDIGKMYTSGQIKLEIHPVIFLDKCSSDHYSARVSGSIAYISEKDPKHVVAFISEIFDEKFQPSEVDYVEMSDEKIIEQAIKAGISREIAKESLNGQYDEWIEKSNDYTILRSDLIAPGREGFATPLIRVNKRIWSMKDMALDDLSDAFVESLYKSCNVLYVYHNHIDATGDTEKTESETVDACEKTFKELGEVVKKLASGNVHNMIITADHGFLYQDRDLDGTEWLSEQPKGDAVWVRKRRFSIGSNLAPGRAFVTFNAAQIGMDDVRNEGISIQVPNSIMRLRMQGAGVKYVHGGAALQEIVVPVLHVSKGRSAADDVRAVEFTILQRTDRLSSRQLTVEFFQNEPVGGKVRARTVLAGLWGRNAADNDVLISNETPVAFDLIGQEKSERHVTATLMLTSDAERFNGTNIELRLREKTAGSNVLVMLEQKARYFFKQGVVADDAGFFD